MLSDLGPAAAERSARLLASDGGVRSMILAMTVHGQEVQALVALELALAFVRVGEAQAPPVWLLTSGAQLAHGATRPMDGGIWGLARAARVEASLSVGCIDAPRKLALESSRALPEPEVVLTCLDEPRVARLMHAAVARDGLVRLHFHSRGAIGNLFVEELPALPPLTNDEVHIHVRAVGLNFRDVLNVLGEYPGDPGPPGLDTAGRLDTASSSDLAAEEGVFGLAHAPLACTARALAFHVASKPAALTCEQICTLPITWSTTHVALDRAALTAGRHLVVQAAAGGVGLKTLEYARWLNTRCLGTAGRPHKHAQLRSLEVDQLCSSRGGPAFAVGASRLLNAGRSHAALNSLSLDFIAASFAILGEGGSLEEIGKRGIWSTARQLAAAASTGYCAIALDTDSTSDPRWYRTVLELIAHRSGAGAVTSLPLRSFDMEMQHELAFRTLQAGLNTGKIVIRVATRRPVGGGDSHLVTGGMGGHGLVTARWLAQSGAHRVVLTSRGGAVPRHASSEWDALQETPATADVETCDVAKVVDARRLATRTAPLAGVWNAAVGLADRELSQITPADLRGAYAAQVDGACHLHAALATSAVQAFAVFSSSAALLGAAGQASFSAAGTCLDALASHRRAHGNAAVSLQWAAWVGDQTAAAAAAAAFTPLVLAQALTSLTSALRPGAPSVLSVLPIVWSRLVARGKDTPPLLSTVAPKAKGGRAGKQTAVVAACSVSLAAVIDMVKRTAGEAVDADVPLMDAGVDSLGAVDLRNQLQSAVGDGMSLPSTLVFEHPTTRALAAVLQPADEAPAALEAFPSATGARVLSGGSVAMSGMAARLPGGISCPSTARCAMDCTVDAITTMPATRWDFAPTDPALKPATFCGYVRNAERVDNGCFGISPAEAAATDPQQRLLLELGYEAYHNSGVDKAALMGSLAGVFVGIAHFDFSHVLAASTKGGSVFAATGAALSIASGRLSYALGLQGPCVTFETACSAALTACHAGSRALQLAECPLAVVQGVNLVLIPAASASYAVAGMTSPHGRCHTLDARADGYVRAEACCGVALGVSVGEGVAVRGSAVRQDGRSASLTAPNGQAQQGLLGAALADAALQPSDMGMVEAHGTGTALGDPIEARSLVEAVVRRSGAPTNALALTAGKANVGHAEPAAGGTGLVKLALQLRGNVVSANAQLRALNPHVGGALVGVQLALPVQLAMSSSAAVRVGSVSSFGYSGTIANAVLSRPVLCAPNPMPEWRRVHRHRAFHWFISKVKATGSKSVETRLAESHTAQCALDGALAAMLPVPTSAEFTVVGAGFAGLHVAAQVSAIGVTPVALEKTRTAGGTWRHHGNAFSRVNSSEPSYRLLGRKAVRKGKHENTNHSYRGEVLTDLLALIDQARLRAVIRTHAEVSTVTRTGEGWVLTGTQNRQQFALATPFTVLATNRRLGAPRKMILSGEDRFVVRELYRIPHAP